MIYLYNNENVTHKPFQHANGTTFTAGAVQKLTEQELVALDITVQAEPEAIEPEPVEYIPSLNPREIRFVLNQAGLREQVEILIANADQTTKDYWEFSLEYLHDHPVLVSMATALGITETQRKQMFIDGASL